MTFGFIVGDFIVGVKLGSNPNLRKFFWSIIDRQIPSY
jgi:hypothetical protein